MNSILKKIAEHKQQEVAHAKRTQPLSTLREQPTAPVRNFEQALKDHDPAIIAEIKKASPSQGVIRASFDVAAIADTYEKHGACCLSVLTDIHFFQGHPSYIEIAKAHSSLPVLRKDFMIDLYQIYESRALGADCILLIVAMLDDHQLYDYCQLAQELGMSVLVESHTELELERAIQLPTPLIGINNRSLHTFKTDIHCTIRLKEHVPPDAFIITESGISNREHIEFMQQSGIHAFLIGETLMRSADIGRLLETLIGART